MDTDPKSEESRDDFQIRIEKAQTLRKWDIVVYIAIMIVVLMTLAQFLIANKADREHDKTLRSYVECQAEWTTFLYRANVAGRSANQDIQRAMDDLVNAVASASGPEQVRLALEKYKAARVQQQAALTQNPLPPPPEEVCQLNG